MVGMPMRIWIAVLMALNALALAQDRQSVDLIVTGGVVVTMDGARNLYPDGSVAVRGDSIVAVGARAGIGSRYRAERVIDARGGLIVPGFINGHTHVPMTLLRGCMMTSRCMTGCTSTSFRRKPRM